MLHSKTIILSALLSTALAGCAMDEESPDLDQIESHSWGGYHWGRTANPFTVVLRDSVTSQWDSYLATTSSDWSKSTVLDTTIVQSNKKARPCKATEGQVEICNTTYGNNGWLGIAQIWLSGGHIAQGVVKLNDTYFNTSTYNSPAWRNVVMCQEVGHTFGLDHQDEDFNNAPLGTCMDYSADPSPNQHPNAHDYEELQIIYSHLDDTNTNTFPADILGGDFTAAASWGHSVGSGEGPVELFVREFAPGQHLLTFVTWAE
jgi:hypothetical protein